MAQSSSVFVTASDARQSYPREIIVHDEARALESAILSAIKLGLFEVTVKDGTPMTNSVSAISDVWTVDTSNSQLFIPNHNFSTGDIVTVSSTIALPAPLSSASYYYIIYVDADHVKLASSLSDAISGRPISIGITAGVTSILITESGTGYLQPPVISFSGGNPTIDATARAYLSNFGSIIAIANSTNGRGYIDQPTVEIITRGSGAVAGAVTYKVVGMSINNSGQDYSLGDILTVIGGTGTAATARVTDIDMSGAIVAIALSNPGSYLNLPLLTNATTTVLPGGGSGATINLTMGISNIDVVTGGIDYTVPPLVKVNDVSGVGAVATTTVIGGSVTSIIVSNPGYGYIGVSSVDLLNGNGATAIAVLQPSSVGTIQLTYNGGMTYTSIPDVNISSQGSGAVAGTVTMKVVSVQLTNPGIGYKKDDFLLISGGIATENSYIRVTSVDLVGHILTYTLESGGSYTSLPGLLSNPVSGGNGTLAAFNLNMGISSIAVASPGNSYVVPPIVTLSAPALGGTPAVVYAVIESGAVTSFKVISYGSNYTSMPAVTISNGSGATALAHLTPTTIADFNINNVGSGYTYATVEISGGGATRNATATANIVGDSISSISIIDAGEGYIDIPTVTITGDGIDATVDAILTPTSLSSIEIITSGSGYNSPPAISIDGLATAISTLISTGIDRLVVTDQGTDYTSDPLIYIIPGAYQIGTPTPPLMIPQRGYGVASIAVVSTGNGYTAIPNVFIAMPQVDNGIQATALATIGAGSGTFAVTPYYTSRDYFKAWKGQDLSNNQLSRPYNERMDTIIAYFKNLGYTINRLTNPSTNNTLMWNIQW